MNQKHCFHGYYISIQRQIDNFEFGKHFVGSTARDQHFTYDANNIGYV